MAMHPLAAKLKRVLKGLDETTGVTTLFDASVACVWFPDRYFGGDAAGRARVIARQQKIVAFLEAAGFRCRCDGEPGAVGEFHIKVSEG